MRVITGYIAKKCKYCKKIFTVREEDVKQEYCSRRCHTIYSNKFLKKHKKTGVNCLSKTRQQARDIYIKNFGEPICRKCQNPVADVHHKNGNITDNSLDNLEALCRSCHTSYHNHVSPRRSKLSPQIDKALTINIKGV